MSLTQQQRDELKSSLVSTRVEHRPLKQEHFDAIKKLTTTSARIRYLAEKGYSRGEIADYLDIRYQHVRNVLNNVLKRK